MKTVMATVLIIGLIFPEEISSMFCWGKSSVVGEIIIPSNLEGKTDGIDRSELRVGLDESCKNVIGYAIPFDGNYKLIPCEGLLPRNDILRPVKLPIEKGNIAKTAIVLQKRDPAWKQFGKLIDLTRTRPFIWTKNFQLRGTGDGRRMVPVSDYTLIFNGPLPRHSYGSSSNTNQLPDSQPRTNSPRRVPVSSFEDTTTVFPHSGPMQIMPR